MTVNNLADVYHLLVQDRNNCKDLDCMTYVT